MDAHVPRLSFSAALTVPMERAGTVLFDKVFVNEGDFYDPRTGKPEGLSVRFPVCPAPRSISGRYQNQRAAVCREETVTFHAFWVTTSPDDSRWSEADWVAVQRNVSVSKRGG